VAAAGALLGALGWVELGSERRIEYPKDVSQAHLTACLRLLGLGNGKRGLQSDWRKPHGSKGNGVLFGTQVTWRVAHPRPILAGRTRLQGGCGPRCSTSSCTSAPTCR
jgi:hypothetical protein